MLINQYSRRVASSAAQNESNVSRASLEVMARHSNHADGTTIDRQEPGIAVGILTSFSAFKVRSDADASAFLMDETTDPR